MQVIVIFLTSVFIFESLGTANYLMDSSHLPGMKARCGPIYLQGCVYGYASWPLAACAKSLKNVVGNWLPLTAQLGLLVKDSLPHITALQAQHSRETIEAEELQVVFRAMRQTQHAVAGVLTGASLLIGPAMAVDLLFTPSSTTTGSGYIKGLEDSQATNMGKALALSIRDLSAIMVVFYCNFLSEGLVRRLMIEQVSDSRAGPVDPTKDQHLVVPEVQMLLQNQMLLHNTKIKELHFNIVILYLLGSEGSLLIAGFKVSRACLSTLALLFFGTILRQLADYNA